MGRPSLRHSRSRMARVDVQTSGGDSDEIAVSLRVIGDDLDPEHVSRLLGVEPSLLRPKGEVRHSGGRAVVQRTGVWSFSIECSPEWALPYAIGTRLDRLPADPEVWAELTRCYRVDLFCGLFIESWNRGINLPAALLRRLADRGLDLDLDIYFSGDPEAK